MMLPLRAVLAEVWASPAPPAERRRLARWAVAIRCGSGGRAPEETPPGQSYLEEVEDIVGKVLLAAGREGHVGGAARVGLASHCAGDPRGAAGGVARA